MEPLRRRVASLVMIRVDANKWTDPDYRDAAYRLVDRGIGGIGVFLGGLEATAEMISELQRRAGNRLLVAADYEYGLPMRLEGGIAFPRAMALGRGSPKQTEEVAFAIAQEARTIGVHWNWAPCADINSNPKNPIINVRSFGEDAVSVAKHAVAYVRGTQRAGVLACAKHAPGHGDTHVDSHVQLPTIDVAPSIAASREYIPFVECIKAGVASVMVGHIVVPHVDPENPASLSEKVVRGLVRDQWDFDGLVVTDALDMKAVGSRQEAEAGADLAVRAVMAGVDVVLMPPDPEKSLRALASAVDEGLITEEMLAAAEARWEFGIRNSELGTRNSQGGTWNLELGTWNMSDHAALALRAADNGIELIGDTSLLPIEQFKQIAVFAVIDEKEADAATAFFHYLAEATEMDIDFGFIDGSISERDLAGLMEGYVNAECVLFCFFNTAVAFRNTMPSVERIPEIMDRMSGDKKRIILSCGSPYGTRDFKADLTINTFSDTTPSVAAAVLRLIGRKPA